MKPANACPPWWPPVRTAAFVVAWLVCLGVAGQRLYNARTTYDSVGESGPEWDRADGNNGHALVDFGGQWLMGRMVATGHAAELYDRNRQWEAVRAGYPRDREAPAVLARAFPAAAGDLDPNGDPIRHDADELMRCFMGHDSPRWREAGAAVAVAFAADPATFNPFAVAALAVESDARLTPDLAAAVNAKAVGGPLYPPVHGFFYAPLGLFTDPASAYAAFQGFALVVTFAAGFAASRLTGGRVWWPVATAAIFLYPGYRSGLDLGQNPALTLTVVLVGWALAQQGREAAGGAVWGLLAFKPVWAAAFLLVPLLTGRWRFALAMAAVGGGLVVLTLPFTGFQPWFDWLAVGREAAATYDVNKNWVELSRDLHGIPRRILLDFQLPEAERHSDRAAWIGWALWATVLVGTVAVALSRGRRAGATGLAVGFVFVGTFLTCYRFMYYDVLLSAAGLLVLFADPGRFVRFAVGEPNRLPFGPRWAARLLTPPVLILGLLYLCENWWAQYKPRATVRVENVGWLVTDAAGETVTRRPQLAAEVGYYHPWETLLLLALWAWCGWRLAWGPDRPPSPVSDPEADMTTRNAGWLAAVVGLAAAAPVRAADDRPTDVRVMTFNVRYGTAKDGANHWDKRKAFLADTVKAFAPDLLGTQETLAFQRDFLADRFPEYDTFGAGRDDGQNAGEMAAVFWRKDRFEKLDGGHFWLSPTPDRPGSKGWDAALPRVATWVKLRDKTAPDAKPVVYLNAHLDHVGKQARAEAARLLRDRAAGFARDASVVVTGDFNAGEGGPPYQALFGKRDADESPVADAYRLAHPEREPDEGTFNGFDTAKTGGDRIDWVGVSRDWTVRRAEIDRTARDGRTPSDHFPVIAVVRR